MRTRPVRHGAILALVVLLAACGGGGGSTATTGTDGTAAPDPAPAGPPPQAGADFTATPVQLTVDPCALLTKSEAEAIVGPVSDSATYDPPKCIWVSSQSTGGQLVVSLTEPNFCKLLFMALDQDMFGGIQVRADDIGDGGMVVKGNGNVQFVVRGGCIEVTGTLGHEAKVDDALMVRLAKTAAKRAA